VVRCILSLLPTCLLVAVWSEAIPVGKSCAGGIGSPCVGSVVPYPSWEGKLIALAVCVVAFIKIWTFRFELAEDLGSRQKTLLNGDSGDDSLQ
jgi:hypothetical protein